MTQQIIRTGTPDKGNGDPIRTAFTKVNANFTELFTSVSSGVVVNATAPTTPGEGDLWWDPIGGRLYISYSGDWIDASPVDGIGNDSYTATTSSDWSGTAPTTVTNAIDRLATLVKSLNNGTGA